MSSSSSRSTLQPKLAREVLTIDDSDNDDDSDDDGSTSSLEILPPVVVPQQNPKRQRQPPLQKNDAASVKQQSSSSSMKTARNVSSSSSSSSSSLSSKVSSTASVKATSNMKSTTTTTTSSTGFRIGRTKPTSRDILSSSSSSDSDSDNDGLLDLKPTFKKRKHSHSRVDRTQSTTSTVRKTEIDLTNSTTLSTTTVREEDDDKQRKKREREEERERKKREREREQQKEREKLARQQRRQDERILRERKKIEEKIIRKRQNQVNYQNTGKYRHEEIVILIEKPIHRNDKYGLVTALSTRFLVHRVDESALSFSHTLDVPSIQFIRKDYLAGGAAAAVQALSTKMTKSTAATATATAMPASNMEDDNNDIDGFEHIPTLVLTVLPDVFIALLRRDDRDEDDNFPELEKWLKKTIARWQNMWNTNTEPRLYLLLVDVSETLDQKWVDHRRFHDTRVNSLLPTAYELQDAIQWLLVNYQVECIECSTTKLEHLQGTIFKMARSLCDIPYTKKASDLECVKKIKSSVTPEDDPLHRASDVWFRQLQQIRGLSENRAQNVVASYPTAQSLWQTYRELDADDDDDDDGKAKASSLLSSVFSGGRRQEHKLSEAVYRIMTSNDPNEMVV